MPIFELYTNVDTKVTPELQIGLTKFLANCLSKPENLFMIKIETKKVLSFGGSNEPCAYGILTSVIGGINKGENEVNGPKIQHYLEEHIGVPMNRSIIVFQPGLQENVCFDGKLVADTN